MFIILIHTKIGCENIIEDYIKNNKVKIINKLAINIVIYFSFILVVIAVVINKCLQMPLYGIQTGSPEGSAVAPDGPDGGRKHPKKVSLINDTFFGCFGRS